MVFKPFVGEASDPATFEAKVAIVFFFERLVRVERVVLL
jgi:hypothetical protein